MTDEKIREIARVICKSRSCEGVSCCQWPANYGRAGCPVEDGGYNDAARDVIAALPAGERKQDEMGWLIEHPDTSTGVRYVTHRAGLDEKWEGLHPWTTDNEKALRFARSSDADDYWRAYGDEEIAARIVEHMWASASPRGEPSPERHGPFHHVTEDEKRMCEICNAQAALQPSPAEETLEQLRTEIERMKARRHPAFTNGDAGECGRLYEIAAGRTLTEQDAKDIRNLIADFNDELITTVDIYHEARQRVLDEIDGGMAKLIRERDEMETKLMQAIAMRMVAEHRLIPATPPAAGAKGETLIGNTGLCSHVIMKSLCPICSSPVEQER